MKVKIDNKEIDQDLIVRYMKVIKGMEALRGKLNEYKALNEMRSKLHRDILLEAGTNRDDEKFNTKLAEIIEDLNTMIYF